MSTMQDKRDLVDLALMVGRDAIEMQSISRRLRAVYTRQCNGHQDHLGGHDIMAEQRDERREARLMVRAMEIARAHGYEVYFQTDPRGCAVFLYQPAKLEGLNGKTPIDECYSTIGRAVA